MTDFYRWQHLLEPSISFLTSSGAFAHFLWQEKLLLQLGVKFVGDSHVCHFINENEVLKR